MQNVNYLQCWIHNKGFRPAADSVISSATTLYICHALHFFTPKSVLLYPLICCFTILLFSCPNVLAFYCSHVLLFYCSSDLFFCAVLFYCPTVNYQSLKRVSTMPQSTLDKSSRQHNLFGYHTWDRRDLNPLPQCWEVRSLTTEPSS